jgi:hypothetical protein
MDLDGEAQGWLNFVSGIKCTAEKSRTGGWMGWDEMRMAMGNDDGDSDDDYCVRYSTQYPLVPRPYSLPLVAEEGEVEYRNPRSKEAFADEGRGEGMR